MDPKIEEIAAALIEAAMPLGVVLHSRTARKLARAAHQTMAGDDGAAPFSHALAVLEQDFYTDADLARWLNAAHPQFEGKTAVEMLAEGRKAEVVACVQRLSDGVYL